MCFYCDRNINGNEQRWWWLNYVCWNCRVQNGILKQDFEKTIDTGRICYRCNKPMTNVGFKFKTPKKNDVKKWKSLENTWENQSKYIDGKIIYTGPKKRIVKQSF